jgi:hypothetical protein
MAVTVIVITTERKMNNSKKEQVNEALSKDKEIIDIHKRLKEAMQECEHCKQPIKTESK